MGTYHQLTEYQRYQIYALKKAGHDQQCIAATVAVSPSTISRELRRNQGATRLSSRPSPSQSVGASSPQGEGDQDDGGGH